MLRGNKDVALAAVKKNGRALEYIDPELIGDLDIYIEIVKEAIIQDKTIFRNLPTDLQLRLDFGRIAIKDHPDFYPLISPELQKNAKIASAAVSSAWNSCSAIT